MKPLASSAPPSPAPALRDAFGTDVDSATLDAAWKGIGARRGRARRVRRTVRASAIAVALGLSLVFVFRRSGPPLAPLESAPHVIALANGAPLPQVWSGAATSIVALDDGSHLELDPTAQLHPMGTHDPTRVELALEAGTTTFDIKPGGPRAWVVHAGEVRVRVLGTRFTVAREGEHVHVSVARGKVRVESARIPGDARDLVAGDAIDIGEGNSAGAEDQDSSPTALVPVEALANAPPESVSPAAIARHVPEPDRSGRLPASKLEPPVDRMAQADAARRAGQPREAIAILTSVVEHDEPGAALAAFTVGKIHSEELGDPGMGASWFERAIRLGLPAGLDEDAHARVVECLGRAGRTEEAARAAVRYETNFPTGRHVGRVRRWKKE